MHHNAVTSQDSKLPFERFLFQSDTELPAYGLKPSESKFTTFKDNFRRYGKNQVMPHVVTKLRGFSHRAIVERVSAERNRVKMDHRVKRNKIHLFLAYFSSRLAQCGGQDSKKRVFLFSEYSNNIGVLSI